VQKVTFAPAYAKREGIFDNGDIFPF